MLIARKKEGFIVPDRLRVQNLAKEFPQGFKLKVADFTIAPGEIIAFLGANGAGKSTLFDLLTGHSDASEGNISLGEEKLIPENFILKRRIGYLPQTMHLPKWVTAQEILTYATLLYHIPKVREHVQAALDYWDCASYQSKPIAACSYGMQKRIGLALATLHDPQYLILDEPFSGLDLFHIKNLENAIQKRRKDNKTTLLSTHILPYVVRSCERVFIISKGQVLEIADWRSLSADERTVQLEQHFFR